ncbi:MAG: hypothetical protein K9N23_04950 [Akkermansiaceae bacterium]|nr:hypothetical protein [Akkermansiaceae bacterium]
MLSWNEIKHRSIAFSRDWKGTTSEKSERQTFWNEFFEVFGIKRRTVAAFEEPVRKLSGNWGYIDLFWPGRVLVEHKTAGQHQGSRTHGRHPRRAAGRRFLRPRPARVVSPPAVLPLRR